MEIYHQIEGRMCGLPHDWGILAEVIVLAGDGDHLEIGTLFGGSAILAAAIKDEFNLNGKIVCVDPLTGYYGNSVDPKSGVKVTKDRVTSNARAFGVLERLEIIPKPSHPWPLEVKRRFASAFIDGDHKEAGVLKDWEAVQAQVDRVVLFDNYDREHVDVVSAAIKIFGSYSRSWIPIHLSGISLVFANLGWAKEDLL
jgi:hypothetical protein